MNSNQSAFAQFIQLNRELLDCYSGMEMNPVVYKHLSAAEQRDFCYTQRVRLEEKLIKGGIKASDFFASH